MSFKKHPNDIPPRHELLRIEGLSLLKSFAGDIADIDNIESLLWTVAEKTISKLGWVDCVIYLKDDQRNILVQMAAFGPKSMDYKSIFEPIEIPIGKGVVGRVASTGESMRIGNTQEFKGYIEDDAPRLSELAVPIKFGNEIMGVIDSEHPDLNFYQAEDQLILETIAGITATKIESSKKTRSNEGLALFYKRNPNPVLQIGFDRSVSFINSTAKTSFPETKIDGMVGNRPGLQKALEKASKKGHSMWRSTNIEKETEPAPKDPNLKQVHQTVTEFHIVHLPSGQFNLYGHDISHILDLQKKAESANEAKSRFLSVMSHEIRTPLNAILGLTDLLTHDEPTRQQQLQHLAYMEFSGKHLLSLVNDILDLEKLAAGNVTGLPSLFNLIDLIQNIGESFQNRADRTGLAWSVNCDPKVPKMIYSDSKWLTQILNNLISNAIKYTQRGSIKLNVQLAEEAEEKDETSSMIEFSVIDTGRGIPSHEIDRILRPFEQIQGDPNIEGTGLGLAIVTSLVDKMDGRLTIKSELDKGSTFTVQLPLITRTSQARSSQEHQIPDGKILDPTLDPATPTNRLTPEHTAPHQTCTILLADDNELNRFVACKLLNRWGHEVHEASNGEEAVNLWRMLGPCLILMDIQMPIMDGVDATILIREEEKRKGFKRSPILALTADAEESTLKRILQSGMDNRMIKPFDPPTLKAMVMDIILQFVQP